MTDTFEPHPEHMAEAAMQRRAAVDWTVVGPQLASALMDLVDTTDDTQRGGPCYWCRPNPLNDPAPHDENCMYARAYAVLARAALRAAGDQT